jgi:hypothetical protein
MRTITRGAPWGRICLLLMLALLALEAGVAAGEATAGREEDASMASHLDAAVAEEDSVTAEDVWPLGEVREYLFEMAGRPIGTQWNQLMALDDVDEGAGYRLNFTLQLNLGAIGGADSLEMDGIYDLTPRGRPLAYRLNVIVNGQRQHLDIALTDSTIQATVVKEGVESDHILPRLYDVFFVDNNMIGQWGLMLALLPLHLLEPIAERIFVPQALAEMDILVEIDPRGPLPAPRTEQLAYRCHLAPIGEVCWVTPEGRLVRLEDEKQDLVVTLLPPE